MTFLSMMVSVAQWPRWHDDLVWARWPRLGSVAFLTSVDISFILIHLRQSISTLINHL